jgi:hypothetical protein
LPPPLERFGRRCGEIGELDTYLVEYGQLTAFDVRVITEHFEPPPLESDARGNIALALGVPTDGSPRDTCWHGGNHQKRLYPAAALGMSKDFVRKTTPAGKPDPVVKVSGAHIRDTSRSLRQEPISSVAMLWETRALRWGRRRLNLNITDQRPLACLASRAGRPIVTGVPLLTCFASSRASQLVSRMQP